MATDTSSSSDPYVSQTIDLLEAVFASYPRTDYAFRLWDGTIWQKKPASPPRFTIVLNHASSLRRMFFPPSDSRLGECYMIGDFDIEGALPEALNLGKHLWETWSWKDTLRFAYKLLCLPSAPPTEDHAPQLSGTVHSQNRDKDAIQYHYDVSNDFYQLWLDKQMVYSCAYFKTPDDDIHTAQFQKLDMICRKLRLKAGERLLDIGCGWGALAIHAAKHYDVEVLGVTLSEKQVELAVQRVKDAQMSDKVSIQLLDYRNVDESRPFDKIVSVGMVEHIGRQNLAIYFQKAYRLLRPGGVFLNHGITILHDEFKSMREAKNGFFAKYIFPDGDVQPLNYILNYAAMTKFEIRDVESLREHYARTLQCWLTRFENNEDKIVEMVGIKSYRLWRLYLLGAGWGFANGLHSIYQTLFYKAEEDEPINKNLPMTREDWYN